MKKYVFLRLMFALALCCGGWLTSASAAGVLYGLDVSGHLFTINLATGGGTLVNTLDIARCGGFNEAAYDTVTKRAWVQHRDGCFENQEVNLATGVLVGSPVSNGASWHGMEFVNGTLYAAGFAGVVTDGLATLNPVTGVSSTIRNNFGLSSNNEVFTGLARDPLSGVMYGITNGSDTGISLVYTINIASGAITLVGGAGIRAGSLEFGPDGNLYAGGVGSNQGKLYRINTANGVATLVGVTGFGTGEGNGLSALIRVDADEKIMVPALSDFALILLACLLLLGAARALCRARR